MKKQKFIKPTNTNYKLTWEPEPYIGDTSLNPHTNIEEPDARILLLVKISKTQFERHAAFEAGPTYWYLRSSSLWWVGDTVILASDQKDIEHGNNNIYAILEWSGHHFVFGRVLKNNIITKNV